MPYTEHCLLKEEDRRELNFFDASKSKLGYQSLQNRIGPLFDMLTFDNYENSLKDLTIRINLKKNLGMTLRQTQATTSGENQATTTGRFQATTNGAPNAGMYI